MTKRKPKKKQGLTLQDVLFRLGKQGEANYIGRLYEITENKLAEAVIAKYAEYIQNPQDESLQKELLKAYRHYRKAKERNELPTI